MLIYEEGSRSWINKLWSKPCSLKSDSFRKRTSIEVLNRMNQDNILSFISSEHNAYLVGGIIGLIVWLFIFLFRKELRTQMLFMSMVGAVIALITEKYFMMDYWKPQYISSFSLPFSDFLFGCIYKFMKGII